MEDPPRHALVTGATGGIGRAICARLAAAGAVLWVAGRDRARCEALAAGLPGARALELDVADPGSIARAAAHARDTGTPPTWIVNNAGIAISAPLAPKPGEEDLFERHLEVNFHGPRRVLEAFLPQLLGGRGRVVQIASCAALFGFAYVSAYCASKHALLGYSRAAAIELAPKGVGVSVLCPWYVDSPMTDASAARIAAKTGRSAEEARGFLAGQNPGGRLVRPEEVAEATLDLLQSGRTGVVLELTGSERRVLEPGELLPV